MAGYRKRVDVSELDEETQYTRAYNYSLWMLGRSGKTEKEIKQKLSRRGYASNVVEKVITTLREYKFVDDENYAHLYAEDCYNFANMGRRGISNKMREKGFTQEHIEAAVDKIFANTTSEWDKCREAANSKKRGLERLEKRKAKERLVGFLMRRGFSPDIVFAVAEETLTEIFDNDEQ